MKRVQWRIVNDSSAAAYVEGKGFKRPTALAWISVTEPAHLFPLMLAVERICGPTEAAPKPQRRHPDCEAGMCGVVDCGRDGPCYVLPPKVDREPTTERSERE
jgi:hypothetical protein